MQRMSHENNLVLLSTDEEYALKNDSISSLQMGGLPYTRYTNGANHRVNLMLHGLYQTGVVLVKNGTAYQPSKAEASIWLSDGDNQTIDFARRNELLKHYAALEEINAPIVNGEPEKGFRAIKPLQAIFFIKIALDNLSEANISRFFKLIAQSGEGFVLTRHEKINGPTFPNGSRFDSDGAGVVLLANYIKHHRDRFQAAPDTLARADQILAAQVYSAKYNIFSPHVDVDKHIAAMDKLLALDFKALLAAPSAPVNYNPAFNLLSSGSATAQVSEPAATLKR